MTAPSRPAAASVFGKENWVFMTSVASTALIPTAVEWNAGTSLDVTLIEFADTARPTQTTNRVTQERRLGDTVLYEQIGNTTYQGGDAHYQIQPQAAVGAAGKAFFEKIPAGTSGFLGQRLNIANATTAAAGQFVNCYPVTFGPSFPLQAGDGETAEAGMTATFAVTGQPAISVALT
jgi:hypothetical protein